MRSFSNSKFVNEAVIIPGLYDVNVVLFLGGFFCSHRETASPDRLWSGVGFRLDDRVYEEDRVTKFL